MNQFLHRWFEEELWVDTDNSPARLCLCPSLQHSIAGRQRPARTWVQTSWIKKQAEDLRNYARQKRSKLNLKILCSTETKNLWPQNKKLGDICKAEQRCAQVLIKLQNYSLNCKEKMEQQTVAKWNTRSNWRRDWSKPITERKQPEKLVENPFCRNCYKSKHTY